MGDALDSRRVHSGHRRDRRRHLLPPDQVPSDSQPGSGPHHHRLRIGDRGFLRPRLMARKFPLFKGATRVATWLLIPRNVFVLTFMFSASLFMLIHLWALLVFGGLWLIEWSITKYDDRMFRIIGLLLKTKVRNMYESAFTRVWGGSSYSPVDYAAPTINDIRGEE